MSKYIKPSSCDKCPAVEQIKRTIQCGCSRNLTADIDDPEQKLLMWKNCPLGWDK